jgi:Zn-dependent peptidase ImmA (M78 family)
MWRGGKWRGRPDFGQIEDTAMQKLAEFQRKLKDAGLSLPEIPPVPAEYIALTISELSVRAVSGLTFDEKRLAGLLDTERGEILYEETDPAGRQAFTIAHELGHYFLHYLPALELARQPTLFDDLQDADSEAVLPALSHYFRCNHAAVVVTEPDETESDTGETPVEQIKDADKGKIIDIAPRLTRRQLEDPTAKARISRMLRLKELNDRIEQEANVFASGLLMPRELMQWLCRKHAGNEREIAAELGVTPTAVRFRLTTLKLRPTDPENAKVARAASGSKAPTPTHVQTSLF